MKKTRKSLTALALTAACVLSQFSGITAFYAADDGMDSYVTGGYENENGYSQNDGFEQINAEEQIIDENYVDIQPYVAEIKEEETVRPYVAEISSRSQLAESVTSFINEQLERKTDVVFPMGSGNTYISLSDEDIDNIINARGTFTITKFSLSATFPYKSFLAAEFAGYGGANFEIDALAFSGLSKDAEQDILRRSPLNEQLLQSRLYSIEVGSKAFPHPYTVEIDVTSKLDIPSEDLMKIKGLCVYDDGSYEIVEGEWNVSKYVFPAQNAVKVGVIAAY